MKHSQPILRPMLAEAFPIIAMLGLLLAGWTLLNSPEDKTAAQNGQEIVKLARW